MLQTGSSVDCQSNRGISRRQMKERIEPPKVQGGLNFYCLLRAVELALPGSPLEDSSAVDARKFCVMI